MDAGRLSRPNAIAIILRRPLQDDDFHARGSALIADGPLFPLHINEGGLISYGPDPTDPLRRAAGYVDRIFKGGNFIDRIRAWAVAVNRNRQKHLSGICRCGTVRLEAVGAPILAASCYCASCHEAGSRFEHLPSAPPVLNPGGGTDYVLYRKDRVQCVTGQGYLEEHRLKPDSPTRRVIATCCNSAMFLDFTNGHWLTMYRNRIPDGAPPLEMRIMTKDRRDGVALADDLPNYAGYLLRLIAAWIAMGLRRPEITWGQSAREPQ